VIGTVKGHPPTVVITESDEEVKTNPGSAEPEIEEE
jgi:hypothetical protein